MHKVDLKSLYFNLAYVFLFSAKTRIYKQNIHKVELKTLYFNFVWLLQNLKSLNFSRTVSQLIMRVRKPTVVYKLVQLCRKNPKREPSSDLLLSRKDKGDRQGIPHTHPFP